MPNTVPLLERSPRAVHRGNACAFSIPFFHILQLFFTFSLSPKSFTSCRHRWHTQMLNAVACDSISGTFFSAEKSRQLAKVGNSFPHSPDIWTIDTCWLIFCRFYSNVYISLVDFNTKIIRLDGKKFSPLFCVSVLQHETSTVVSAAATHTLHTFTCLCMLYSFLSNR